MEKTKVSIIIPIFQVENYIERCIFSVIDQSYDHSNIECILIDDCGKDKSILIAQKCIDNYHGCMKFIVIHHKQNMGLSVSRNNGMKVATGDYIFFLDSDDYITPNCINLLVSKIHKNHEIEVIKGNHIDKRNNDSISSKNIPSRIIKNKELLTLFFLERIPCLAWNTLISRDLIEKNHLLFQPGLIYEDILWSFNLFKVTNTFLFIPDITLYYEVNPKSIVNANQREDVRQIKSRLYILKEFLSHIENRFYEGIIIYMTSMILGLIDRMKKNKEDKDLYYEVLSLRNQIIKRTLSDFRIFLSFFELLMYYPFIKIIKNKFFRKNYHRISYCFYLIASFFSPMHFLLKTKKHEFT